MGWSLLTPDLIVILKANFVFLLLPLTILHETTSSVSSRMCDESWQESDSSKMDNMTVSQRELR